MNLEGKVALVTGGARGQGRAISLALARQGCDIAIGDLTGQIDTVPYPMSTPDDLDETRRMIEDMDRRCAVTQLDTRDFDAVSKWVDSAVQELGGIDFLNCNAGITSYGQINDIGIDVWRDMIDTNLSGVFHTIRAAADHMIERGSGSIVATSSAYGRAGAAGFSHYAAAKWGVIGLVKSAALDLGPHGIRVNGVAPTAVNTPMLQNDFTLDAFAPPGEKGSIEAAEEALRSLHALDAPWVQPEDIANAYVFLHSEEARYITGTIIDVGLGLNANYTA
jgi:(+)-trans-carveol dehydrogenase